MPEDESPKVAAGSGPQDGSMSMAISADFLVAMDTRPLMGKRERHSIMLASSLGATNHRRCHMADWHGMKYEDVEKNRDAIPALPQEKLQVLSDTADPTMYAHCHFNGNYGANFCSEFQSFDRFNLSQTEAVQAAWSTFGLCGHQITCYDSDGNLVWQS